MDGSIAHRVTLDVCTDGGRRYLYDDASGMILPWDDGKERVLGAVLAGDTVAFLGARDAAIARAVRTWRASGAFERLDVPPAEVPPARELESIVRRSATQLILSVSDACNLRCSYCCHSADYPLARPLSSRRMEPGTALAALDWFAEYARPARRRDPSRRFGLALYGGEPLLAPDVVVAVLEHAARQHPGVFAPVITTNGVLLDDALADALVAHDVHVAVSLDGPAAVHDARRRDAAGGPTHARILGNLERLRVRHPDFFARRVTALAVYDCGTDLDAADAFFAAGGVVPAPSRVNAVARNNGTYYRRFGAAEFERHGVQRAQLAMRVADAASRGTPPAPYARALEGAALLEVLLRRRTLDARRPFAPHTGTCLPGTKVAVLPDGTLGICERVTQRTPLGHLDSGGVDFERVRAVLDEYRAGVESYCTRCPATRLCATCFAHTETPRGFEHRVCFALILEYRHRIGRLLSILERNPAAADALGLAGTGA